MITDTASGKLEKLRESRPDWDQAALDKISDWEKALAKLILEEDYATLSISKEIIETLKGFVKQINRKLVTDPEISDRGALIADKNRCLWLLRLLCRDYDAEIKDIEKDIDYELEAL